MKALSKRLRVVEKHVLENHYTVMIIGFGSVGTYLLDYLISACDPALRVVVVGRNRDKMEKNVNIVRIAALIRGRNQSVIDIVDDVDLNDIGVIKDVINAYKPDFIVNSSRAYPGLKYGSISWNNIRAYGIWTPLAIRFVKNIMSACEAVDSDAITINTSYSDAVISWLKSAGRACPDFGSGNLNHLVPRIKYAISELYGIFDFWNIDIAFAAGHFHDVCISKEGQTEDIELPLKAFYDGGEVKLNKEAVFDKCKISMPVDAQRNMMNASSNFAIINTIVEVIRTQKDGLLFIPGAFGNIGGYPVKVGYRNERLDAWIDASVFSVSEMNEVNNKSMYLDGIEAVKGGSLYYTDELIEKVKKAFEVTLPKKVPFDEIDEVAKFLIDRIIVPQSIRGGIGRGGWQDAEIGASEHLTALMS